MPKTVDLYFDYTSPASYLAWAKLPAIAERTKAEIVWKPIFLGALFKAIDHVGNIEIPAKFEYTKMDVQRAARHLGVPFKMPPDFPVWSLPFLRWTAALIESGADPRPFIAACFREIWEKGRNLNDRAIIAEFLSAQNISPEAFKAQTSAPEIKARLKALNDEAVARGVFGAPAMFVGDELFWGQDRLDYVERALSV
ncbi:MAG: 2-hydroxychromene-2-carboxylate isomerase [Parvularculaceae bacterium]